MPGREGRRLFVRGGVRFHCQYLQPRKPMVLTQKLETVPALDRHACGEGVYVHAENIGVLHEGALRADLRSLATQRYLPAGRLMGRSRIERGRNYAHARNIAAWTVEAGDKSILARVAAGHEDDRNRRRCSLGRKRRDRVAGRSDHGHLATHKIGRKRRQTIVATLGEAILDRHCLALDVTSLWRNAATKGARSAGTPLLRNPTTGIAGCCAPAPSGHATAALPRSEMKSRRLKRLSRMVPPRFEERTASYQNRESRSGVWNTIRSASGNPRN